MNFRIVALAVAAAFTALPVLAVETVKIGFVTTLTTPAGVIGRDMVDAVNLAIEHIGGKMGGFEVELIVEDDGFKPEIGKQKTDKLVKRDDVDFVAGYIWSHVLLASRNSALRGGEQQMLAIGRALMTNPERLILDEATEGLAPLVRQEIWVCLEQLKAEGLAILAIDKNVNDLKRIADKHFIIDKGMSHVDRDAP